MGEAVISSSSAWLQSVIRMFASQGVDPAALFEEAGFDAGRLEHVHERIASPEINRLWEIAVRRSGQPTLGLDRQLARRFTRFDIAIQAMWHGPRLVDGLEGLSHYLVLVGDAAGFTLDTDRTGCWLALANGSDPRVPRQRVEYGMLALLSLCQQVTRQALRPLAVEFIFPEPADFHPYRMAFQCPLRFGQAASRMKLGRDDLALPLHRSAESLLAVQERVIEGRLERLADARTSYRAGEEIIRRLHLGEVRRSDIARSLGLAEADLEKRLRNEGHAFADLLDDVRKELASEYLALSVLPLAQVAGLLGWDTSAELAAASRRWFRMSPTQYRQHLQAGT